MPRLFYLSVFDPFNQVLGTIVALLDLLDRSIAPHMSTLVIDLHSLSDPLLPVLQLLVSRVGGEDLSHVTSVKHFRQSFCNLVRFTSRPVVLKCPPPDFSNISPNFSCCEIFSRSIVLNNCLKTFKKGPLLTVLLVLGGTAYFRILHHTLYNLNTIPQRTLFLSVSLDSYICTIFCFRFLDLLRARCRQFFCRSLPVRRRVFVRRRQFMIRRVFAVEELSRDVDCILVQGKALLT
mmetsp:Transcript_49954/g.156366  ORF Transcript_49954/g.156366 Transcript_49954/m.156366 type:complete len:235 (+) Transcript_49954:516-1220(+)